MGDEEAKSKRVRFYAPSGSEGRFDALVDWVFNLWSGHLASTNLLKCLNAGRYDDAVEQLLLWTHAGGRECSALVKRREAKAVLWRN
jgi:GH24 family phage-related lysozyme (muramidase)